jgi:maleylacetoacetate isomerase
MTGLKLYSYFRSSASYRVRIALHWKKLPFEYLPVHLTKAGGEQHLMNYKAVNPMQHVPTLIHGDFVLPESMAIVDYLDKISPEKPLFPADPKLRARTIQVCEIVNSGIQPYQNLKVLQDFEKSQGWTAEQKDDWVRHWVSFGLASLDKVVEKSAGRHAVGDEITAADAFIIPQLFGSRRFKIDIAKYPHLAKIEKAAISLEAFQKAHPESQPDYER